MSKTIFITGSTDGIGQLAATQLAKDGHTVYLHGRSADKLTRVIEHIKHDSGNDTISGFVADFADLSAVKRMAQTVLKQLPKLDVLINNAGVFNSPVAHDKNGFDIRFTVNYFAPVMLTHTLLPLLTAADAARVINLSSAAQASVSLSDLAGKTQPQSAQSAYAQSKLALTQWTLAFARQHPHITSIAVNPGSLLNTRMANEAYGQHWSSADKGGNILYELAMDSAYQNATGKYFDNDQGDTKGTFAPAHADAYNDAAFNVPVIETQKNFKSLTREKPCINHSLLSPILKPTPIKLNWSKPSYSN